MNDPIDGARRSSAVHGYLCGLGGRSVTARFVRRPRRAPGSVRVLAQDFAVGLDLGGELDHGVEHGIEVLVGGLEGELLGEEVDLGVLHAVELLDGVLELAGADGAVDLVELENLTHDGVLSVGWEDYRGRPGGRLLAVPQCRDSPYIEAVSYTHLLDTAALTGESVPRHIEVGGEVISGCINMTGVLRIRTTKLFGTSTVSRILELVENASEKKARTAVSYTHLNLTRGTAM